MEHLPRSRHRAGSCRPSPHQISVCVLLQAAIIGRPLRPSLRRHKHGRSHQKKRKGGAARYYNDEDANDPLEDETYYGVNGEDSQSQNDGSNSSDDSSDGEVDGEDDSAIHSGSQTLRVKACRRSIKKSGVGYVMHPAPRRGFAHVLLDDIRRSKASAGGFGGAQQRGKENRAPLPSSAEPLLLDHKTYYEPPLQEFSRRLESYSFPSVGGYREEGGQGLWNISASHA